MLRELFESFFYHSFNKVQGKVLMLNERSEIGDFSLVDQNACRDCRDVCCNNKDLREQLKLHSNQITYILSIDQVFSFINDNLGERCDYLLEGADSVILVEMSCITSNYVEGKRQKARKQLSNTIDLLFANPMVKSHIEKKKYHYVVFSWKETFPDETEMDDAEKSMAGMTVMTDEVYSPDNESIFDYGFKYREIRYPDVLEC